MLASEILDNVRSEILEVSASFWSNDELLRFLNRGLQHYINQTRMTESFAFLTTTPGERRYTLPSNALSVKIVMFKEVNDDGVASWSTLVLSTLERIAFTFPNFLKTDTENRGVPSSVAVYDRILELNKSPEESNPSDLFIFYKSKPANVPNIGSHVPIDDVALEGIIQFMLWKAWMKEKELALAKEAKNEYEIEIRRGRRWVKKQMGMLRNRFDIVTGSSFTFGRSTGFNPLNQ